MKQLIVFVNRVMPLIFAGCIVFTTIMALIPTVEIPDMFKVWDKLQHALAFTTLTLIGSFAYSSKTKVVYIGLIFYGAAIEIAQYTFTTTRVGDVHDLFADIVGVMLDACLYLIISKIIQQIRSTA